MTRKHFSQRERVRLLILPLAAEEQGRGTKLSPHRHKEILAEIHRLMIDGYSQTDIGEALSITRSRLSRMARHIIISRREPARLIKHRDKTLHQIIWARIGFGHSDDCWPWLGFIKPNGYGSLNYKGKTKQAHRAVYECFIGSIDDELVIDHICQNKKCVNPNHLQQVTQSRNLLYGNQKRTFS